MTITKKAYTPAEGIYYVVPRKDGHVTILSQRADEVDTPTHMFYWDRVLAWLQSEYKLRPSIVESLRTAYQGLPRGRVQEEIDTATFRKTGRYIIVHGGDVPISTIRYAVIQDFGLGELESKGKVQWVVEAHEKMDSADRSLIQKALKK